MFLVIASLLVQHRAAETRRQADDTLAITRRAADLVEREIAGLQAALQSLATSPALRAEDWPAFDRQAREVAASRGGAVVVRDRNGQQIINTYVAYYGKPLPVATDPVLREADREALRTARPVISDVYVGAVARRHFVLVVMPVPRDGEPRYVVNLAIEPRVLSELIGRQLPGNWIAVVLDRQFRIVARSTDHDAFVGRTASPEQIARMTGSEGTWRGHTLEGTPILAAHTTLPWGWRVGIGVPVAAAAAPARDAALLLLAATVFGTALSLASALWFASRLQAQIRAVADAGISGELQPGTRPSIAELRNLSDRLQRHEQDRRAAAQTLGRYASLVEATDDAIIGVAENGEIEIWSRGAERLFGYSAAEMVGTTVLRIIPEERSAEREQIVNAVRGGRSIAFDTVRRHRDGRLIDVTLSAAPISAGERKVGLCAILSDITRRKRAELEMARLAAIVSSSNDAILTTDMTGVIQSWNTGAEQLFGYSAAEAVGSSVARLVPEERSDELAAKLAAARELRPLRIDTVRRRKDGSLVDVAVNSAPIIDAAGTVRAVSIVAFEITERKRAEAMRELLLRELDHRLKNVFGTISALIGLAARHATSVDELAAGLTARVRSLSAVHDLIRGTGVDNVTGLADLIRAVAKVSGGDRITIAGPDIRLSAGAAIALSMVLHELATSALRHGAWSVAQGRVDVTWAADGSSTIVIEWRESGPHAGRWEQGGFGLRLMERVLASLDGKISFAFEREGMSARIEVDRARLTGA